MSCNCSSSPCSCGSEVMLPVGPEGPQGQQGEQGIQGVQGDPGQNGSNGTLLDWGQGVPVAAPASEPATYIDVDNRNIWEYPVGGPWANTGLLLPVGVGIPGNDGADGNLWYTGAGAPVGPPAVDTDGQMYLDTNTGDLYQWDSGGATWGSSVGNIRGPQGSQGIQGVAGAAGANGADGADGNVFIVGSPAPVSGQGNPGDIYFETGQSPDLVLHQKTNPTTWSQFFTISGGINGGGLQSHLFRAFKTVDQPVPGLASSIAVNFEDSSTLGYNYGNTWSGFEWVADQNLTDIRFVLENFTLFNNGGTNYSGTVYIRRTPVGGGPDVDLANSARICNAGQEDIMAILDTGTIATIDQGDIIRVVLESTAGPVANTEIRAINSDSNQMNFYNQNV